MSSCFHCSEPVPPDCRLAANVGGVERRVCCPGCKAAAEWIDCLGLADYYRLREAPAARTTVDAAYADWDRPRLARMHVRSLSPGRSEVAVLVEGIRCSACAWLIERALGCAPGVLGIAVNPVVRHVRIAFDPRMTRLSVLLQSLARLGYTPHPLVAATVDSLRQLESRTAMKRLAIAGLGMMQAMMYAVALYAGAFDGMDGNVRGFFRLMDMLVAMPVVLYAARPFFEGAWREWRMRRLSMDTPIALSILAIYVSSVASMALRDGEVYFDSVSMFVFFLLLGRFIEMRSRHRAGDVVDALLRLQPSLADRRTGDTYETIGVHELDIGDRVRVASGGTFPADGVLVSADCRVDEALLTGESTSRLRRAGDSVIAGSIALDGPVEFEVRRLGADTVLSDLARLVERAGSTRPRIAMVADAAAARFVLRVLIATVLTAIAWLVIDPARAFPSAIAVLVISCPCAFALAAPSALTRAAAILARKGVLVIDANALEALANADCFVFDKTGTLTEPGIDVAHIETSRGSREEALGLAAALEQGSAHPLARAISVAAYGIESPIASGVTHEAGGGVSGMVGCRRLRLGRAAYALGGDHADADALVLADDVGEIARFPLCERIRMHAAATVAALQRDGARCEMLSGDHRTPVATIAGALGMQRWNARVSPQEKLARLQTLRAEGHLVAMIGDGVNDAPVLANADVAIAIGHGAALAHAASGILLADGDLGGILRARAVARQMLQVLRRNLRWTVAYNLGAVPLAALGLVPPWLAALGMSASSLLVIVNSFAIGKAPRTNEAPRSGRGDVVPVAVGAR